MSTVAYRNFTIVGDTSGVDNFGLSLYMSKVSKLSAKSGNVQLLFGGAGDMSHVARCFEPIRSSFEARNGMNIEDLLAWRFPVDTPDCSLIAVLLERNGSVDSDDDRTEYRESILYRLCDRFRVMGERDFHAIGSGRDFALAAMHLGHDAQRAVDVAAAFDYHTNDKHEVLAFDL